MSEPFKIKIIDVQEEQQKSFEERYGIVLPLRAILEDKYPQYDYRFGVHRLCLAVFKRRFFAGKPIIKVFQDGKIEMMDKKYNPLVDFIAEQLITLMGK